MLNSSKKRADPALLDFRNHIEGVKYLDGQYQVQ